MDAIIIYYVRLGSDTYLININYIDRRISTYVASRIRETDYSSVLSKGKK